MRDSQTIIASLRQRIGAIEGTKPRSDDRFGLGPAGLDARLGGGLARGRLHEIFAAEPQDAASAAGFALMLAMRASAGPMLWLREERVDRRLGHLHAPGLVQLGLDPRRLVLVLAPDEIALLRAAGDVVRCPAVGVLLIEPWRHARAIDLTASRRLAVAAEQSGVTILMVRIDADPGPSAAHTRWQVRAAASDPLDADAPGHPALEASLLRHRGGRAGLTQNLEWDRDILAFREPPLSGALVPLPAHRPAGAGGSHEARRIA